MVCRSWGGCRWVGKVRGWGAGRPCIGPGWWWVRALAGLGGGGGTEREKFDLDGGELVSESLVGEPECQDHAGQAPDGGLGVGGGRSAVRGQSEDTGEDGVDFGGGEDCDFTVRVFVVGVDGVVGVGGVMVHDVFRFPLDRNLSGLGCVGRGSDLGGSRGGAKVSAEEGRGTERGTVGGGGVGVGAGV